MATCNFCSRTHDRVDKMYKAMLGDVFICSICVQNAALDLARVYKDINEQLISSISTKDYLEKLKEEVSNDK